MRDLDRLCAAALRETARKKRKLAERNIVARMIEADTRDHRRSVGERTLEKSVG